MKIKREQFVFDFPRYKHIIHESVKLNGYFHIDSKNNLVNAHVYFCVRDFLKGNQLNPMLWINSISEHIAYTRYGSN